MIYERTRERYVLSTDPTRLELDVIHGFLTTAYWSPGITREKVQRAIDHSLPFGIYPDGRQQVGFARLVTDYTRFAYLADVFILEPYRGQGLGTWLIDCILSHPELQDIAWWLLATKDAHGLYRQAGFTTPLTRLDRLMERRPFDLPFNETSSTNSFSKDV